MLKTKMKASQDSNVDRITKKPAKRDKNGRKMPLAASRDLPMRRFIENVPETEFSEALRDNPDPKFALFYQARMDPAYINVSFSELCRKFQISLADVDDMWRKHQLHKGMIAMMNQVPQILTDVAEDAKTHMEFCQKCDGTGVIPDGVVEEGTEADTRTCPRCAGLGEVKVIGDKAARDLVFESIGLIGKKVPFNAIQMNFGLDSGLEDVLMSTSKLITKGEVIDGDNDQ